MSFLPSHYTTMVLLSLIMVIMTLFSLTIANQYILESAPGTTLILSNQYGKIYRTDVTDPIGINFNQRIIHLWGEDEHEQGYNHGRLLADDIHTLLFQQFPAWFQATRITKGVGNSMLPDDINELLKNAQGEDIPKAMNTALNWVWTHQLPYMRKVPINYEAEIDGIAQGYCAEMNFRQGIHPNLSYEEERKKYNLMKKNDFFIPGSNKNNNNSVNFDDKNGKLLTECDQQTASYLIKGLNMFPELVRMGCTITATWGNANGGLFDDESKKQPDVIQSRLLDFGASPLVNAQLMIVRHFSNFKNKNWIHKIQSNNNGLKSPLITTTTTATATGEYVDFMSQSFPGFVGTVTTLSSYLSQSQKVFLDYVDRGDGDSDHAPTSTITKPTNYNNVNTQINTIHTEYKTFMDRLLENLKNQSQDQIDKIYETYTSRTLSQTYNDMNTYSSWLYSSLNQQQDLEKVGNNYPIWSKIDQKKYSNINSMVTLWSEMLSTHSTSQTDLARIHSAGHQRPFPSPTPQDQQSSSSLTGYRPGNYDGIACIFAIREVMQRAKTLQQTIDIVNSLDRTWPIFLAFGTSIKNQQVLIDGIPTPIIAMTYERNSVGYYSDFNINRLTGLNNPILNNALVIDRHPQPSSDWSVIPTIASMWGRFSAEWLITTIPTQFKSSDVHGVWYDWNTKSYVVSVGFIPPNSMEYKQNGKAFERPWVRYDWNTFFTENPPQ